MKLDEFQFALPEELIAKYPLATRSQSRLLQVPGAGAELIDSHFYDVLDLLQPNDLLVANNTKVMPARLFGHKASGGKVEIMIERITGEREAIAMLRASKRLQMGSIIHLADNSQIEVMDSDSGLYTIRLLSDEAIPVLLERLGQMPLPPYLQRQAEASDRERYQTVYAKHDGAVAAPTAGLHFDDELLATIQAKGVGLAYLTLHVGLGTFQPIRSDDIKAHQMHHEWIDVPAALVNQIKATKANGGRIIAVGTTTVRALETASQSGQLTPFQGDTNIFIYPGFTFHCVDVMITNFHLPGSSLMLLVSAFAGVERIRQAYQHAISKRYRFYSYGDAMWLEGKNTISEDM